MRLLKLFVLALLSVALSLFIISLILATVLIYQVGPAVLLLLLLKLGLIAWTAFLLFLFRKRIHAFLSKTKDRIAEGLSYARYRIGLVKRRIEEAKERLRLYSEEYLAEKLSFVYKMKGWKFADYLQRQLTLGGMGYTADEFMEYMKKSMIFTSAILSFCFIWNFFPFHIFVPEIAWIQARYSIPIWIFPVITTIAFIPFILLSLRISHRKSVIEKNLPFLSLLIAIGTILRTSLSRVFSFIEDHAKDVWKKDMELEARQLLNYVKIYGESQGYRIYGESQPNPWLRDYLKDYASEFDSGGDLRTFTVAKLRDSMENFKRKLERQTSIVKAISIADLCFVSFLPMIIFTLMLVLAGMGAIEQIGNMLNIMAMVIVAFPTLAILGIAFKPHLSMYYKNVEAITIASLLLMILSIPSLFHSGIFPCYLILLALSLPFAIFYIYYDKVNSTWLKDFDRFLLDVNNEVKIGRSLRNILMNLPLKYSSTFNRFLEGMKSRLRLRGIEEAYHYGYSNIINEDVRKTLNALELMSAYGTEDPSITELLYNHFNTFRESISNYKKGMISTSFSIIFLSIFITFFMLKMMVNSFLTTPAFASVSLYLPMISMLIPFMIFEGAYVTDVIVTGNLIGGFRLAFFCTLLALFLAYFMGFL